MNKLYRRDKSLLSLQQNNVEVNKNKLKNHDHYFIVVRVSMHFSVQLHSNIVWLQNKNEKNVERHSITKKISLERRLESHEQPNLDCLSLS